MDDRFISLSLTPVLFSIFPVGGSKFRRDDVPFGVFFTRYYLGKAMKIGFWQAGTQAAVEESKFLKDPRQRVRDHRHQTFGRKVER